MTNHHSGLEHLREDRSLLTGELLLMKGDVEISMVLTEIHHMAVGICLFILEMVVHNRVMTGMYLELV